MTTFGVSAPGEQALAHFGFTAANVADKARALAAFYPQVRSGVRAGGLLPPLIPCLCINGVACCPVLRAPRRCRARTGNGTVPFPRQPVDLFS